MTYGWIVGGDPSVTRAVAVAVVYLAIGVIGLVPPALNVLLFVAVIVTLADPLTVIDSGAWLSFGATFGIIVGAVRLMAWHDAHWPRPTTFALARRWLVGLCGATLAAELTLLPVTATLFNRVGVAGFVLNVVAIPMIAVVQVAGIAGIALVGVWDAGSRCWLGQSRGRPLARCSDRRRSSTWRRGCRGACRRRPDLVVAAFYLTGLAWIAASRRGHRRVAGIAFAMVCARRGLRAGDRAEAATDGSGFD